MQVLVDGVAAQPGVVIYCSRTQQLSATLGGILQSCSDTDGDGTITSGRECAGALGPAGTQLAESRSAASARSRCRDKQRPRCTSLPAWVVER